MRASRSGPLACVLGLVALATMAARADDPSLRLDRAELFLVDGSAPPAPDARGEIVPLPDDWRSRRPTAGGVGWYRFTFRLPSVDANEPLAVYLPSVNMNAEVFVNGVSVGACGRFDEPVAHCFNRPLLFRIPVALLVDGANRLDVKLFAYAHHYGRLGPIEVGREAVLLPDFERRHTIQVTLSQVATAIVVVVAIFVFALWIASGFEGAYGYFVIVAVAWSIGSLNYWLRDVPVPHWTWERIVHPALDFFLIALTPWIHRLLDLRRPRVELAAAFTAALSLGVAAFVPVESFYPAANWMHVLAIPWAIYPTTLVIRRRDARALGRFERAIYAPVALVSLGLGLHDAAIQFGLIRDGLFLIPFIAPLILPTFGATLTRRFVEARRVVEATARELEDRVEARERELARNYERLQDLERERAASEERQRLTREMHDGLGGHLVSTLSLVEAGEIDDDAVAEALRFAVEDMRMMLGSVTLEAATLAEILGIARERLQPVVLRHGLDFVWNVPIDAGDALTLDAEDGMHVLRILQESVTNGVRHARARTVTVAVVDAGAAPVVRVEDDGHGFAAGESAGRGLRNMAERAERLGARLRIDSGPGGTRVELELGTRPPGRGVDQSSI